MSYDRKLSREEFLRVLNTAPKAAMKPTRVDWEAIFEELKRTNEPLTIRQIWEHYVKKAVTYYRTKNVLQEAAAQNKCLQIWYDRRYWFYFGERLEEEEPSKKSSKKKRNSKKT